MWHSFCKKKICRYLTVIGMLISRLWCGQCISPLGEMQLPHMWDEVTAGTMSSLQNYKYFIVLSCAGSPFTATSMYRYRTNLVQIQLLYNTTSLQNQSKIMMTSSNGNIFRVTFPSQRPGTRNFDVWCLICAWRKTVAQKQSRRRWFETFLCSLWRKCNDVTTFGIKYFVCISNT